MKLIGRHKYIQTAVLIPTVVMGGEARLLFQVRHPDIPQGSEICFPGGKFDSLLDGNSRDTAVRETVEELGIRENAIAVTGFLGTLISASGVAVDAYTGELNIQGLSELDFNEDEVDELFTLPVSFFTKDRCREYSVKSHVDPENLPVKELGLPERYEESWGGRLMPVYVFPSEYGPIWGITAELIVEYMALKNGSFRINS